MYTPQKRMVAVKRLREGIAAEKPGAVRGLVKENLLLRKLKHKCVRRDLLSRVAAVHIGLYCRKAGSLVAQPLPKPLFTRYRYIVEYVGFGFWDDDADDASLFMVSYVARERLRCLLQPPWQTSAVEGRPGSQHYGYRLLQPP